MQLTIRDKNTKNFMLFSPLTIFDLSGKGNPATPKPETLAFTDIFLSLLVPATFIQIAALVELKVCVIGDRIEDGLRNRY